MFCPIKSCSHVKKLLDDTFINVLKEEKLPCEYDGSINIYFCEITGKNIYTTDKDNFTNDSILLKNTKTISFTKTASSNYYNNFHYWKYQEAKEEIEYLLVDKIYLIRKEKIDQNVKIFCFDIFDKQMSHSYKCFDNPNHDKEWMFKSELNIDLSSFSKDNLPALFSFKLQKELEDYLINFDIIG